ncbi:MAG: hypothetical protein NC827_04285 [Candidatus Omnitrophica bacterium]|nr:hypothetical protein [Candidatus Omnitrophota bacterium]MCM8802510.1 hypothetical protein [Candidatus Omnitrophota bacterium]
MKFFKSFLFLLPIFIFNVFSQVARHSKLYVVPTPGKVVIDGKLDDWDLSGQLFIYVVPETSQMQSAKFAAMYDREALYLSAIVKDTTPMMNRHDPFVEPDRGWDADSCQFRIVLDPSIGYPVISSTWQPKMIDKLFHLTLWYFTDRQEPVLQIYKTMKYLPIKEEWKGGVVPKDKFSAVYIKGENEYTFEYKIPWEIFGVKFEDIKGKILAGVVQFCWSAPDGLKTAGGSAWAYDVMSGPGFPYQSTACWGGIIFSEKGDIPKELVEEGVSPEKPLPLTFTYNLPEDGEVTIQIFDKNGNHIKTILASAKRNKGINVERWDGLDENGNPIGPGEYIWKGLYHKGLKTKFLFSVHNSGNPPYKTDDNKGGWGGDYGSPQDICSVPDGLLLCWDNCESGWGIIKVDLKGNKIWGIKSTARFLASDGKRFFASSGIGFEKYKGVRVFDLTNGKVLNFENGQPIAQLPVEEEKCDVSGLFYKNGYLYISYEKLNLIGINDAKTGKLLKKTEVENPSDLLLDENENIYVISKNKILKIDKEGKKSIFIEKNIEEPTGLAIDNKGNFYVSNRGDLMNITVFDKSGRYLKSIGKKGGRPKIGKYKNDGVLYPKGIDIDQEERLWVAESCDSPKRISVWDIKTGKLVKEFFGGSNYSTWSYIDIEKVDEIYCHNVIWKIDWKNNKYYPYSTIWRATEENMILEPAPGASYAGHFRVITAKNGKQFGWGASEYGNKLYMRVGDIFKPISGVIRLVRPPGYSPTGSNYKILWDNPVKYPDGMYFWQDKNDNQKIEESEIIRLKQEESNIFNWFDKNLNAYCDSGFILRPIRFEKDGRPVYDINKKEPIPFKGVNSGFTSLTLSPDEKDIIILNPGQKPGFACYDKNWNLKWAYNNIIVWHQSISLPVVKPGNIWGLTMPLGITDVFTGAASYFGPFHIFTTDGIYVGMLMKDGRIPGLGPDINACENFTGQLLKIKNRYILLNGDQDGRVTEIIGLENVKRLEGGIYKITEDDFKRVKEEHQKYQETLTKLQKLIITKGKESLSISKGIKKIIDNEREFTVKVAYDNENLYLFYDVKTPFELTNSINDYKIIFKGGNLIDIQIGTDKNAPKDRERPTYGDLRILVTRQEDKPVAVIYRPKVKDFKGTPIVLSSPTGKEEFDIIEKIEDIKIEYKKTNYGFTATVSIPLKLLGLELKQGEEILMDVGYIFGNINGSQVSLRSYWSNNSFAANVIYDIPTESRLEPKYWGKAIVE